MLCLGNIFRQNNVLKTMHFENVRALNPWLINQRSASRGSKGKNRYQYKQYVPPCSQDHDYKNMALKRPMSPHLQIYKPTLESLTSIFQRMTGVLVTGYALLLSGGILFLHNGIDTYVSMIQSLDLSRPSIFIVKIIFGAPFLFHYFNGIRFCAWNAGRLLAKKDIADSAYKSWVACAVMVLFFAIL